MEEKFSVNKKVIVKFYENGNKDNSSKLITRTLGKVGFISRSYEGALPKDEEFWLVNIADEVKNGERKGCFILEPVSRVQEINLERLLQGFYDSEVKDGVLYVYPKEVGNWVLPLQHKRSITDVYAILVVL